MNWLGKNVEATRKLILRILFKAEKDTDKNSQDYWNTRWFLNLWHDRLTPELRETMVASVKELMARYDCETVLEIGCGASVPLRGVEGVAHLDYSTKALKRAGLTAYIYGDITKHIPVPDKAFDAAYSSNCLIHVSDDKIQSACDEIGRVTRRLVILNEGGTRNLESYFKGGLSVERLKLVGE